MKNYQPYKFWERQELADHLIRQAMYFVNSNDILYYERKIETACYDTAWNPIEDYDGCSFIQDKFHPYVPCILHDYSRKVLGGGKKHDVEFRKNLIIFGTHPFKAWRMYFAVRIGWFVGTSGRNL